MTDLKHGGRRLQAEIRTTASPEQVWQAWTDPEKIAHWFVDRARGKPEVGTVFTWIFEKFGYEISYEVVAAEPGRRFALGGEIPGREPFLLEITIAREGGQTVVTLVNSGFLDGARWDEEYEGVASGWANALAVLKHYLERYFGMPKTAVLLMQPATYPYDRLLPYFTTSQGLCRWLATSASIGEVGEPCELELSGVGRLTGRVLSKTRWEVVLSWNEFDATLELKGFQVPGAGKVVGLRALAWGPMAGPLAQIERPLQASLCRLAGALEKEAAP